MTLTIALKKGSIGLLSHKPIEHATAASDVFGFEPADLFPIVFFLNLTLIYSKKASRQPKFGIEFVPSITTDVNIL